MSKKLKLSQWHDGSVKPVHVGFYNVICNAIWSKQSWSYWDGKFWSAQNCSGIQYAKNHIGDYCEYQNKKWRGIVK